MADVKNILFPVDFTESSLKVLPYARLLTEKFGAKLHLIYVIRGPEQYTGFELGSAWFSTYESELRKGAAKAMENFVDEHLHDAPPASASVVMGDIVDEILKKAEEVDADLVVVGTHGRKGLEKMVFGSVAEGVVRRAACPVLTVNPFKQR
ncbi:universal stress protein [Dissulfurirhabdus thermomarina]|uniref:Universal stress protein n=1 Tax=Dissulfurirhabdus thermomarina TaxID=1765737 RepID=A0A6N9TQP8_DISTH|nr:universal stress protein [Dissulfurirhabdus thermomarina]NDY43499.1 universal stress protein [Dissulfurirhabdus thermomarina]NMX24393.1 universal stress protein [Dissulfurirhabdus thermomarina]